MVVITSLVVYWAFFFSSLYLHPSVALMIQKLQNELIIFYVCAVRAIQTRIAEFWEARFRLAEGGGEQRCGDSFATESWKQLSEFRRSYGTWWLVSFHCKFATFYVTILYDLHCIFQNFAVICGLLLIWCHWLVCSRDVYPVQRTTSTLTVSTNSAAWFWPKFSNCRKFMMKTKSNVAIVVIDYYYYAVLIAVLDAKNALFLPLSSLW